MPGKASAGSGSIVGALVAGVAVFGWVAFDWGFNANDGTIPLLLGVAAAIPAIAAYFVS
jgi:hypothetical protein